MKLQMRNQDYWFLELARDRPEHDFSRSRFALAIFGFPSLGVVP